jgi:NAD(P)-dependent dehydrogenase (short-subunit alcohol dehydrogenase family)
MAVLMETCQSHADIKVSAFVRVADSWCSRGFFNFAQKTLPLLEESVPTSKYPPTLIVTGATASVRGTARFAAFAAGKWAKRALAQSIAREYGPKGVHVAHAIIDGVIDIPRTAHYQVNGGAEDGKISPDSVSFEKQPKVYPAC